MLFTNIDKHILLGVDPTVVEVVGEPGVVVVDWPDGTAFVGCTVNNNNNCIKQIHSTEAPIYTPTLQNKTK